MGNVLNLTFWLLSGMPSITLNDVYKLRLDSLSFFLTGFVLCTFVIRWLWNALSREFPRWPVLSVRGGFAVTTLWGLLFLIVLTMISGARELLTPGAWRKVGFTYELADDSPRSAAIPTPSLYISLEHRRERLELLKLALWAHAGQHEGRFPDSFNALDFPASLAKQPGDVAATYRLQRGLSVSSPKSPLAWELAVYDPPTVWLLDTAGAIQLISSEELRDMLIAGPTGGDEHP